MSSAMRLLLFWFIITALVRATFTVAVGASVLKAAFAISKHKAHLVENPPNLQLPRKSRQTAFESIPICHPLTGQAAVNTWGYCFSCFKELLLADLEFDSGFTSDTCPAGCCGEYSFDALATAHFIGCKDGCCSRLVFLQVTGVGEFDRCSLDQTPAQGSGCGPRCAYLFRDPDLCEGRETINVPIFGADMDPNNLPCAGETPSTEADGPENGENGSSIDGTPAVVDPDDGLDGTPVPSMNPTASVESVDTVDSAGNDVASPICIDAKALRHLRPEDLVFKKHTLAHVLCDENDSCATPGHIVVFRGKAMMMTTYCGIVECSKRVMHVNSPRFKRQVRVPSSSDRLEFTAFAARYETRAEEAFISAAVRIGL